MSAQHEQIENEDIQVPIKTNKKQKKPSTITDENVEILKKRASPKKNITVENEANNIVENITEHIIENVEIPKKKRASPKKNITVENEANNIIENITEHIIENIEIPKKRASPKKNITVENVNEMQLSHIDNNIIPSQKLDECLNEIKSLKEIILEFKISFEQIKEQLKKVQEELSNLTIFTEIEADAET